MRRVSRVQLREIGVAVVPPQESREEESAWSMKWSFMSIIGRRAMCIHTNEYSLRRALITFLENLSDEAVEALPRSANDDRLTLSIIRRAAVVPRDQ